MNLKKALFYILIILILAANNLFPEKLVDIYKKGIIKLENDPAFAKNVDWQKLFGHWDKSPHGLEMGLDKNIVVASDGTIFVSNRDNYKIYKFAPDGTFLKEFGRKGSQVAKGQFPRRPELFCIQGDQFLVVRAWHGGVNLFDLEGNYMKTHRFDFMPNHMVSLANNNFAVTGFVVYKKGGKDFAAILNNQSGKVREVCSNIYDFKAIRYKKDNFILSIGSPGRNGRAYMAATPEGNFLVGFAKSPNINLYSPEGTVIKKITIDIKPILFTKQDRDKYINNLKKSIKEKRLPASLLDQVNQKKDFFPSHMPYFYHLMVDSDGNILVFYYPEKEKKYMFRAYSPGGKAIADVRIDTGNYDIGRLSHSFAFHKGDLYGIFQEKISRETPLRLIKVKLAGN